MEAAEVFMQFAAALNHVWSQEQGIFRRRTTGLSNGYLAILKP